MSKFGKSASGRIFHFYWVIGLWWNQDYYFLPELVASFLHVCMIFIIKIMQIWKSRPDTAYSQTVPFQHLVDEMPICIYRYSVFHNVPLYSGKMFSVNTQNEKKSNIKQVHRFLLSVCSSRKFIAAAASVKSGEKF